MSKVIITNTIGKPLFVFGKLLAAGASMEVENTDVPECLQAAATPVADGESSEPPETAQTETPAPSDEDLLLAAAKAKGK